MSSLSGERGNGRRRSENPALTRCQTLGKAPLWTVTPSSQQAREAGAGVLAAQIRKGRCRNVDNLPRHVWPEVEFVVQLQNPEGRKEVRKKRGKEEVEKMDGWRNGWRERMDGGRAVKE